MFSEWVNLDDSYLFNKVEFIKNLDCESGSYQWWWSTDAECSPHSTSLHLSLSLWSILVLCPVSQLSLLPELCAELNWTSLQSPAFWRSYHRSQLIRTRTILPGGWIFMTILQANVKFHLSCRKNCFSVIQFIVQSVIFWLCWSLWNENILLYANVKSYWEQGEVDGVETRS